MSAVEDINTLVMRGQQYEEQAEGQEGYTAINTYRLAASSYGDAARLAEGLVGPYDASTLTYRDLWAVSLKDAGDIEAAILCEVENIKRHKKTYGQRHDSTLDAMRRLALNYLRCKRYGEALELYESVVDVLTNKKAEIGVVCQSRTDWATALFESGTTRNVMQAVNVNAESLLMAEKAFGADSIETVRIRDNLARDLAKLSKYEDASAEFQKNIEILHSCGWKSHEEYKAYLKDSNDGLKACTEKIAKRKKEQERLYKLRQEALEKERLQQRKGEWRQAQMELETIRLRHIEEVRVEKERSETLRLEKERLHEEQIEKERLERKRLAKEQLEKEQLKKEQLEIEQLEKERLESEQLEKERLEREYLAEEQLEQERLEKEKFEKERLEKEQLEKERLERENLAKKQLEKECLENEQPEKERLEKETLERERLEREKLESERTDQEVLEKEKQGTEKQGTVKLGHEKERIGPKIKEQEQLEKEDKEIQVQQITEEALSKQKSQQQKLVQAQRDKERLEQEKIAQERLGEPKLEDHRREKEEFEKHGSDKPTPELLDRYADPRLKMEEEEQKRDADTNSSNKPRTTDLEYREAENNTTKLEIPGDGADNIEPWTFESNQPWEVPEQSVEDTAPSGYLGSPRSIFKRFRVISDYALKAASTSPFNSTLFGRQYQSAGESNENAPDLPCTKEQPAMTEHDSAPEFGPAREASLPISPISIICTEALPHEKAESPIPGSWHHDFDVPSIDRELRRIRSNSELLQQQTSTSKHKRSSSLHAPTVLLPARHSRTSHSPFSPDEIMRADEWFADLKALSHTFLDKYQTDDLSNDRNFRRVRIAILDTGIAFRGTASAPVPELIKENIGRVKLGKALDKSLPPHEDTNGHGTHAAGLILQVCPYANIYIYRVLRGEEPISHKLVTEALIDAIDKKKVDIVSMSLGWNEDSDEDLRAVIDRAKTKNVLIFAATSNEGIRRGIAYPARADEVIAIDAADVYGSPSKFNPPQGEKTQRFMVLGEAVRSAWPTSLNDDWNEEGWKRMSGTSFATPIAAAIAGLILEFSRQRPLCFDKKVENHLKSVAGMREVFSKLFSLKTADSSHFKYLDPFQLFHCISREEAGGEWYENLSPRLHAANAIVQCLRNRFSRDIGSLMNEKLEDEWSERRARRQSAMAA